MNRRDQETKMVSRFKWKFEQERNVWGAGMKSREQETKIRKRRGEIMNFDENIIDKDDEQTEMKREQ